MDFWQIFWTIVSIALTGLTTWLVGVITNFFNKKIKDSSLQNHALTLLDIVQYSVMEINQTYVSEMKKAGKFDKEAQQVAFDKCYTIIQSKLTPQLREYITDNFGDIASHIKTLIEATVYQTK